jgi:hypothetical protein
VIYRDALAELRRVHSEAPWSWTGVVVDGTWAPAAPGIGPASHRQIEAGLVAVVQLPAFIATDIRAACDVALEVARMAGYAVGEIGPAAPRWYGVATTV